MEPLTYQDFKAVTRNSRRAFHLEQRDTYSVGAEDEPFGRWLRGEADDYAWHQDWLSFVREATATGVQVQRARLVSIPHTDYTRWGLAMSRLNAEAGEDIRYLPRSQARDIDCPPEDYWLMDDDKLVLSIFSEDGRTGGFARENDPGLLRQCVFVRDRVWDRAIPCARYLG
ncbi:MAG TPA: hypothetical protein VH637_13540 [Streptosporangiaceae bacterium]|jgi:hypothetical protein